MTTAQQAIKNALKTLYVKNVMAANGWTCEYMTVLLVEFATCRRAISLHSFIEEAKQ